MVKDDLTNRQMFDLLMEEIAAVYKGLKQHINDVEHRLDSRIDELEHRINGIEKRLDERIDGVESRLNTLNFKTDQNHITFMHHVESYDGRLLALEIAK